MARNSAVKTQQGRSSDAEIGFDAPNLDVRAPANGSSHDASTAGQPIDTEKDAVKMDHDGRENESNAAVDPDLVSWDGPQDPKNPKNWTWGKKWRVTISMSLFTFITPVSSSLVAPALPAIANDLDIQSSGQTSLVLSIFVLAYAVGPLILGPISEIYGRYHILQFANAFFLLFNICCGFAQNKAQLIAFRFLAGLGGSAPLAVGGGLLSDIWTPEERGKSISIYSLGPLIGPALGPVIGAVISEHASWRWGFWATSIADAVIQVIGFLFLRETYPAKLLGDKVKRLRLETGNNNLYSPYEKTQIPLAKKLGQSFSRPFLLLFTQPIVQVLALYMAYLYGVMYLVLSTYSMLWTSSYNESVTISGLNYLSLGIGFLAAAQIGAPINDRVYKRLKAKAGTAKGKPEFRIPLMMPGAVLVPCGLFIYAWTAQYRTFWLLPNIGAGILSMGVTMSFQCIQAYLVDTYTRYAASAIAAATVLRSICGFAFPLFAPYLYARLDYGWGNSLLGFIAVCFGLPVPFVLWRYGEALRLRSQFSQGDQIAASPGRA